jgi:uncharacterized protein with NRDE domain
MCTLIVRQGMDEWCATVIAANRDEFYERPASGPQVLSEAPHVVGGRDERAGGTWLGFTNDGLFVGLTNQRTFQPPNPRARSRGELVIDALRTGHYDGVKEYLDGLDPREFNEFNLIYGDGTRLSAAYGRGDSPNVEFEPLGTGVHVLCNDRLDSPDFPKAEEARAEVASIPSSPWETLEPALISVLGDRSLPDPESLPPWPDDAPFDAEVARRLQAICVETPVYGTVSSTLAAISPGRIERYAFRDGPPDSAPFVDFTELARNAR